MTLFNCIQEQQWLLHLSVNLVSMRHWLRSTRSTSIFEDLPVDRHQETAAAGSTQSVVKISILWTNDWDASHRSSKIIFLAASSFSLASEAELNNNGSNSMVIPWLPATTGQLPSKLISNGCDQVHQLAELMYSGLSNEELWQVITIQHFVPSCTALTTKQWGTGSIF